MRIRDWSSDVCSSDLFELRKARERGHVLEGLAVALANIDDFIAIIKAAPTPPVAKSALMARAWDSSVVREMLARDRQSVVSGKSVSVRVALGGGRILKQKKPRINIRRIN